jgi:hypothetical protein
MNQRTCSTDSPRFHLHLFGVCRGRVHIGVLSIRLVLQSFCRPRRPGKKHAVTVNTVSFYIPPGWQLHSKWLFTAHRQHGLEASQCGSIGCDVIKRMVRVTRDPEPVEKDSKFSSDRNPADLFSTRTMSPSDMVFELPFSNSRTTCLYLQSPCPRVSVRLLKLQTGSLQ